MPMGQSCTVGVRRAASWKGLWRWLSPAGHFTHGQAKDQRGLEICPRATAFRWLIRHLSWLPDQEAGSGAPKWWWWGHHSGPPRITLEEEGKVAGSSVVCEPRIFRRGRGAAVPGMAADWATPSTPRTFTGLWQGRKMEEPFKA